MATIVELLASSLDVLKQVQRNDDFTNNKKWRYATNPY